MHPLRYHTEIRAMIDLTEKYAFFYKEWPSNFYRAPFTYTSRFNGGTHEFIWTEQAFYWNGTTACSRNKRKNLSRKTERAATSRFFSYFFGLMVLP